MLYLQGVLYALSFLAIFDTYSFIGSNLCRFHTLKIVSDKVMRLTRIFKNKKVRVRKVLLSFF